MSLGAWQGTGTSEVHEWEGIGSGGDCGKRGLTRSPKAAAASQVQPVIAL